MKKVFLFCSMVAIALSSCGNKTAENEDSAEEAAVVELQTPDLAFLELQGAVKEVTRTYDGNEYSSTYQYNEEGALLEEGDWDYEAVERNENGQIVKTSWGLDDNGEEWATEYDYAGGTNVVKSKSYGWESISVSEYTYEDGRLVKEECDYVSEGTQGHGTTTYTYDEFDEHGNWTKRTSKTLDKYDDWGDIVEEESTVIETREILYY